MASDLRELPVMYREIMSYISFQASPFYKDGKSVVKEFGIQGNS